MSNDSNCIWKQQTASGYESITTKNMPASLIEIFFFFWENEQALLR